MEPFSNCRSADLFSTSRAKLRRHQRRIDHRYSIRDGRDLLWLGLDGDRSVPSGNGRIVVCGEEDLNNLSAPTGSDSVVGKVFDRGSDQIHLPQNGTRRLQNHGKAP